MPHSAVCVRGAPITSAAEEELQKAKVQPQCVLTVLQILTQESVDLAVRQSAVRRYLCLHLRHLRVALCAPLQDSGRPS